MDALRRPSGEQGQGPAEPPVSDRLDSWKEVAQFLRRDIRTVQRWEATEGLPIYRHQHSKNSSIYAYKSEVDSWWRAHHSSKRQRRAKQKDSRAAVQRLKAFPYPQIAICACAVIALGLFAAKAKQMFLNRPKASAPVALLRPASIAVLPFQSISASPQDAALASNITEELISHCRQIPGLHVVDAASFHGGTTPQQMGHDLKADKLLRGTADRSGDSLRITAELIDSVTGAPIWAQTFDQSATDLLKTEESIANAIVAGVQNTLAANPPSETQPKPQ